MAAPQYEFEVNPESTTSTYGWLLRFAEGAETALEIGCSTGFFARHLIARGCRVVGVEVNPDAARQARDVCRRVIVGDIEDPRIQGQVRNRFEVVVLGDLLEHLKRPGALLKQIRDAWLTHDGRVVASVPNSGHWIFRREVLRGRFPYREYGLFDRTHLRFYTRSSFAALLEGAGYRIEREAFAINSNSYEDITFLGLKPLYRRPAIAVRLHMVETRLAHLFPALFAYQFVVCARPKTALETRR